MVFSPTRYRFTVKDYHRMAEAEVFDPKDRVELVDGDVLEMAPIDSRRARSVNRLTYLFVSRPGTRIAGLSRSRARGCRRRRLSTRYAPGSR